MQGNNEIYNKGIKNWDTNSAEPQLLLSCHKIINQGYLLLDLCLLIWGITFISGSIAPENINMPVKTYEWIVLSIIKYGENGGQQNVFLWSIFTEILLIIFKNWLRIVLKLSYETPHSN